MRATSSDSSRLLVTLTVDELEQRVAAVVAQALARLCTEPARRGSDRLTLTEVAAELRCSQRQVRRLIAAKRLRSTKLESGGSARVLVARSEVERLLAEAIQ